MGCDLGHDDDEHLLNNPDDINNNEECWRIANGDERLDDICSTREQVARALAALTDFIRTFLTKE